MQTQDDLGHSGQQSCPECKGTNYVKDFERGEISCIECGYVVEENIKDLGPEWRAFDLQQIADKTRTGAPVTHTIHDKGLSTIIDNRNVDAYGRQTPTKSRAQHHRLRKWQIRSRVSGSKERNLAEALAYISKVSSALKLPKSAFDDSCFIYRQALDKKLIRGRSIEGVAATSLYIGGRRSGAPRSLDEVAEKSGIDKKVISRNYRELYKNGITPESHEPVSFVSKLCNELHLTTKNEVFASKLIKASKNPPKTYFGFGKSPAGMAAATLYISSVIHNEPRTQREIAELADVTEVTIRNIYKAFIKGKEDKIDKKTGVVTKGHKPLDIIVYV